MYFAIKYARKKQKERQAAKLAGPSAERQGQVQPGVEQQQDAVEPGGIDIPASPVEQKTDASRPESAVKSGEAEPAVVSDEEALQKKKRRQYRVKIIFGLVAPFALQALDTTIIASALPYIAKDFSKYTHHTGDNISETPKDMLWLLLFITSFRSSMLLFSSMYLKSPLVLT
jgi:hypothetical protein